MMSSFSYWKQHNHLCAGAAGHRAHPSTTEVTPHTDDGASPGSVRPASHTRSVTVPRALFLSATADLSPPPPPPPLPHPQRTACAEPSLSPVPRQVMASVYSPPRPHGASADPARRPSPSSHRPASAMTPGIRRYYNHLAPLTPDARRLMHEYRLSAPTSRAASARPPAPTVSTTTTTTHNTIASPPPQPPQPPLSPVAARARASASSSTLLTTSALPTPGHWTETRKPRPSSPTPGHRRTSQNLFAAIPTQPEEVVNADGRRRSNEASFSEHEVVRVLLEHLPNIVARTTHRTSAAATAPLTSTWLSMPSPPTSSSSSSAAGRLTACEDRVTASAQMGRTGETARHPFAHLSPTEPDVETLDASLRAQTSIFREGEDGRPVTAMPLHRRLSPVMRSGHGESVTVSLMTRPPVAPSSPSHPPPTAHATTCTTTTTTSTTAAGSWQPTIVAMVGLSSPTQPHNQHQHQHQQQQPHQEEKEAVEEDVADMTMAPTFPRTLGDYDWIQAASDVATAADTHDGTHPHHDHVEDRAHTTGRATTAAAQTTTNNITEENLFPFGEDDLDGAAMKRRIAGARSDLDDTEEEEDIDVGAASLSIPVVMSSIQRPSKGRLLSVAAIAAAASPTASVPSDPSLVVATPHRHAAGVPVSCSTSLLSSPGKYAKKAAATTTRTSATHHSDRGLDSYHDEACAGIGAAVHENKPLRDLHELRMSAAHGHDDVSPPPRLPDHLHDMHSGTSDTPDPSAAALTPEAVREPFVDLLPGLQPRAGPRHHSLELQKGRLAHAVPIMLATTAIATTAPTTMTTTTTTATKTTSNSSSHILASPGSRVTRVTIDTDTPSPVVPMTTGRSMALATTTAAPTAPEEADALRMSSPTQAEPFAGDSTIISGLLYPSSTVSTPSVHLAARARPANPRLSQQPVPPSPLPMSLATAPPLPQPPSSSMVYPLTSTTTTTTSQQLAVPSVSVTTRTTTHEPERDLTELSVGGSRATTRVGSVQMGNSLSRTSLATEASAMAMRTAASVSPRSVEPVPGHLASQLRQAIRDASLMRLENSPWAETDDGAPLSVASTH